MPRNSAAYYAANPDKYEHQKKLVYARKTRNRREQYTKCATIKAAAGCADCGERDAIVLDFDHRDPADKRMTIATLINRDQPWSSIETEIAKCDVRCANCHRRRTAKQFNWYGTSADVVERETLRS